MHAMVKNESRQGSSEWRRAVEWSQEWANESWEEGDLTPESKWARGREWVRGSATEQEQQAGQSTEDRRKAAYASAMTREHARRLETADQSLER
jgi:hypothetical protein